MESETLLLGQTISFNADPFDAPPDDALVWRRRGGVLVRAGRIEAVAEAAALIDAHPHAARVNCGDHILAAGFVDCHNHYSQTRIVASWGERLIDWLNRYTFPEEMRFADPAHAAAVASDYLDLLTANGTTAAATYCTIHPESVDALFSAAEARGMAITAGKVMMDRNAPAGLCDDAQSGFDQSKALIDRWSGRGRLAYAVTPRFAPTSSETQLAAAGALWAEHPDLSMQTHLSEQVEEIDWVRQLFPDDEDYLAVYQRHGLCGPGAIMGHSIHLTARETAALAETGAAVAHCPTSNTFIGSGLCDVAGLKAAGVEVGLATDTGGGSSFSMLATMKAAYEVAQLRGRALHPAQLFWLATAGSARAMRRPAIGRLAPGAAADIIALDPAATPVLAQRTARAKDIFDILFALVILGDDRAISETWIAGHPTKGCYA
ncbi:guanine deaminase [Pikeienuella piscinae]|uniref:Guanine deaminase n=1 Tax=Pikeienuella piscinae TaxID=2748098 RepID=A0A7L5BSV4_9RHOB|nr:guanine deaminase [Pikeienuella piscinae]QIE54800.1 guanine deaminase [Pikeienuella piscinae]